MPNLFGLAALSILLPAVALASPNLVVNGDFDQTSMYVNGVFTPQQMNSSNVTGWSTSGYNFIFGADTASTTGSYTPQFNGSVTLWSGSQVSGGAVLGQSPTGGNFVGADGAFETGAITQTLTNLTKGTDYAVSFDWAAAQQNGFTGPTTNQWVVGFGNQTQSTGVAYNASHGFTGWMHQTFVFEASDATQLLSFLANGTPAGVPPFALLDGVSAVAVPEPASLALLLTAATAVAGLAFGLRRRATA